MKKTNKGVFWGDVVLGVLCAILALVLIGMIFVTVYANRLLGKINYVPDDSVSTYSDEQMATLDTVEPLPTDYTGSVQDPTDVTIPEQKPEILIQGDHLVNILLIGQDRRPGEIRSRSDTMIVCTVNKKTNTITLTSFLRDTYVMIPGYKMARMNVAYAKGGMPLLKKTFLENFGIVIDGCFEVDFDGFQSVIDLVGGVDIELTAEEAEHLNSVYGFFLKEGMNHLNGREALGYSRLRKIDSDYNRAYRQRKLLRSIISSSKNLSFSQLTGLLEQALPMLTTDMTQNQISKYALELFPVLVKAGEAKSLRIPAQNMHEAVYIKGVGEVLVPDMNATWELLQEKLLS